MGALARMYQENKENKKLDDYYDLLYDQGLLTEGSPITDPLRFSRLVSELMVEAAKG